MRSSAIALVVGLTLAGCASDRETAAPDGVTVGRLGHPLGTYVQIEGVREERSKGSGTLLVDRVGDREISPPIGVWIDGVELPPDVRCVLRGYESGRWIGIPDAVLAAEAMGTPQAVWQFQRYFIPTSVQAPQSLVEQFGEPEGRR